jgi:hypothetical protein
MMPLRGKWDRWEGGRERKRRREREKGRENRRNEKKGIRGERQRGRVSVRERE